MQNKQNIQQEELERDGSGRYVPLYEVKAGTKKNHRIHKATKQLGMQNVADMCEELGFILSAPQIQQFLDYLLLIQKWNQSMNLVGKSAWKDVLSELVVDSFYLAKFLEENPRLKQETLATFGDKQNKKKYSFAHKNMLFEEEKNSLPYHIWDLGSGAGLPGIPLRILWNCGDYSMVEIREKRCIFLNTALIALSLPDTQVIRGKAEDFMEQNAQKGIFADLIISRAFMPFEKMLPFVSPFLRKEEVEGKAEASIIFLTLEKLDASKIKHEIYQWETKSITPYKVKGKEKYLCEVVCKTRCYN